MAQNLKARAQQRAEERKNGEPGTEVVKADPIAHMLESWKPELVKQFPLQLRANPDAWMRMALTGMRNSKQAAALAACDRPSLYAALLEAGRFGLTPFTDEAAIVPYGKTATFIPMAQGFVKMFWNTGQVSGVVVDFVRKGEMRGRDWELIRGSGRTNFWHKPLLVNEEGEPVRPGEPLFAYFYLEFRDGSASPPTIVTRFDAEDVMTQKSKAWQYAENTGKRDSLWHTDFPAMWLKTAVRRGAKYGPKSAELQELLMIEVREDRTRADAPPPPPVDGAGIDWSADVAGGNVAAGEVVPDDAPPPEDPGVAQDKAARAAAFGQMNKIFGKHGMGGKAHEAQRRAVITGLVKPGTELPAEMVNLADLPTEAVQLAASRLDQRVTEIEADESEQRTVADLLADFAQRVTAQIEAP